MQPSYMHLDCNKLTYRIVIIPDYFLVLRRSSSYLCYYCGHRIHTRVFCSRDCCSRLFAFGSQSKENEKSRIFECEAS